MILALTVSQPQANGWAQQPAAETEAEHAAAALEIRELVEQLQTVREQLRREQFAHRDRLAVVQRQIDTLQGQVAGLEEAVADEQSRITAFEAEIARHAKEAARGTAQLEAVAKGAAPVVQRVRGRIEQSPGEQRLRRLAMWNEAAAMLNDAESPARQLEGLRTVVSAFGEEWIAARTVVLNNEPVMLDGGARQEHAWVVTFGTATKIFTAEDGGLVGIWSGDPQAPWQLDLPAETQQQIRRLMGVVRENQPPAITPLPVQIRSTLKTPEPSSN